MHWHVLYNPVLSATCYSQYMHTQGAGVVINISAFYSLWHNVVFALHAGHRGGPGKGKILQ